MEEKTKVYVVQYREKLEYDFSVKNEYLGCFFDRDEAIDMTKNELKKLIDKYKDKDMLEVSQDYSEVEHGYAYLCFGEDEDFSQFTISIDELEVRED